MLNRSQVSSAPSNESTFLLDDFLYIFVFQRKEERSFLVVTSKSIHYEALSFASLAYHKQSELGTGWGSYAVALLVSLLISLMIAKFIGLRERCFVLALCTYTTFEYLVCIPGVHVCIHSVCLTHPSQRLLNQHGWIS